jgi:peptidoglycan LD-endopeptidase CwlK
LSFSFPPFVNLLQLNRPQEKTLPPSTFFPHSNQQPKNTTTMIDFKADPKFWQRFLACAGFYKDTIDGDFGTNSQKALHEFEQASIDLGNSAAGSFDGRSEGNIQTLLPAAQRKAREFMKAVRDAGITIKIISGTRTFAEQHALFTQVPHVTKADAGHSNHNFGVAWDIGDFTGGTYHPESEVYKKVGEIGKKLGLEWGGDWHGFKDEPHFQAVPETELKNIAAKFESGTAFV